MSPTYRPVRVNASSATRKAYSALRSESLSRPLIAPIRLSRLAGLSWVGLHTSRVRGR
jgi:hypothetical protein